MRRSLEGWTAVSLVVAATVAAHAPILRNGFTTFDDGIYVLENPHVRAGLDGAGLVWAFGAVYAGNWHPLTWISHMLDWQLWGPSAAGHHATSLLLHAANAAVLFAALRRLTGSIVRSALVAALFGVHPLQVESVAWVAERKSLLCTLFWWLALLGYARFAAAPSARRLALVTACAVLALMSKPMAVTLPFTLLLLDVWPLDRWDGTGRRAVALSGEKWPLFVLSAASCVMTIVSQHAGRAILSLDRVPWSARLTNLPVSYALYLCRAVWPRSLAVYYPHPLGRLPAWEVGLATLFLAALSWLAWTERSRRPYLTFGWLWYLGTLVPVIGLVQVGSQAMADRYAYVPLVGIFVAGVWGAADAAARMEVRALRAAFGAACILVVVLAAGARAQARTWKDTQTLFTHDLAVTGDNAIAHFNLGLDDARKGRLEDARREYEAAILSRPYDADLHNNLGIVLARQGALDEAIARFTTALRLKPAYGLARANLAAAYFSSGRPADAWEQVELARKSGFEPPADFLKALRSAMPEP